MFQAEQRRDNLMQVGSISVDHVHGLQLFAVRCHAGDAAKGDSLAIWGEDRLDVEPGQRSLAEDVFHWHA